MDVFSAQGRDPTSQWRLVGSVKFVYDKLKSLHGYVYVLEEGSSTTASRITDRTTCECCSIKCIVATLN